MGKPRTSIGEVLCAVVLRVGCVVYALVVIDDNLLKLGVALAWQQHICARILQHRHKIWQHEALREEILHSFPKA